MPAKTWTSQSDFETGTLSNVVATGGTLALSPGSSSGYWESEIYEAVGWAEHRKFIITSTQPEGTVVNFKFRQSDDSSSMGSWSDPIDGTDENGKIVFDMATYLQANPPAVEGKYVQFRVYLYAE